MTEWPERYPITLKVSTDEPTQQQEIAAKLLWAELTGVTGGVLDTNPSNYRKTVTITNDDKPSAAAVAAPTAMAVALDRPASAAAGSTTGTSGGRRT